MSDENANQARDDETQEEQNVATESEKLDGIVEQTRADLQQGNVDDAQDVLRQRLHDAGIEVGDDEFDALLARLTV